MTQIINAEGFDSNLQRKFDRWRDAKLHEVSSIVSSLMHPISKQRLESFVPLFMLNETPLGFLVVSAESVSIASLSSNLMRQIREKLVSLRNNGDPEDIVCVDVFSIETSDGNWTGQLSLNGLGRLCNFAQIQENAWNASSQHKELIEKINIDI
jgi:hypothetical protein